MARQHYVSVAGDDWYQRRRQDDEGEFFRKVAAQGPRKQDGSTQQGIYVFTADGKLLAFRNHRDAEVMRSVIGEGLQRFHQLPASQRGLGAIQIPDPQRIDKTYHRVPPKNGLVVTTYTRILERDAVAPIEIPPGGWKVHIQADRDGECKAPHDVTGVGRTGTSGPSIRSGRVASTSRLPSRVAPRMSVTPGSRAGSMPLI